MRNFVDSVIKFLISTVILLVLCLFIVIAYFAFFAQDDEVTLEDTLLYAKSLTNQASNFTLADKNSISLPSNINSVTYNSGNTTSNNLNINKFYYNQLDDTSKIIYTYLEKNINNLKEDNYIMNFGSKFNDLLHKSSGQYQLNKSFQSALDAFFYDHPELFYIDLTKISLIIKYTTIGPITKYTVSLEPQNNKNYLNDSFKTKSEVNQAIYKVENIKNNLLKNISNSSSNYKKALAVHDAIVNSLDYDSSENASNSHDIYGALVENKAVCEGYAKSFKYILDSLNIECILVSGNATNSSGNTEAHMWNYIKLNNDWYGVDLTWDDPVIIGGFTKNITRHNYFCKGNNVFSKSHKPSRNISDNGMLFSIPKLNTENYK